MTRSLRLCTVTLITMLEFGADRITPAQTAFQISIPDPGDHCVVLLRVIPQIAASSHVLEVPALCDP